MAKSHHISTKRVLIDKTNSRIVLATAVAAFLVVFSLVASKALISQLAYQNRIIDAKKTALTQLKDNIQATDNLASSYKAFVDVPQNLLGGNPSGSGDQDGDNAKIILDALPSQYDFPALATSLQKIVNGQSLQIQSIVGTDEEATQQSTDSSQPVAMPFQLSVTGNYQSMQKLINTFEHSIRPFQIQTMELSGGEKDMTLNMTAQTFYQPAKQFKITTQVIQ